MVLLVEACKALVEVALFVLVGQAVVGLFAGNSRNDNFVYRLFQVVTAPVFRFARFVSPRFVLDQHIPIVAFMLLVLAWGAALAAKVYVYKVAGIR
jgi:hypothetical protein